MRRGRADSLVIAASAQALQGIRGGLSKEAAGVVNKTMSKDCVDLSDRELTAHFG